jgi:DNA-binding NarL/FixJ family response regulator
MKHSGLAPTQNPHAPTADLSVAPLTVNCLPACCFRERSDPIRVAYVDDDWELLKLMASRLKGLRLVMCFATGEEALKSPAIVEVQVVLMDIRMPGIGGIACTRLLKKALPSMTILMLTGMEEPGLLWEAFIAGANGFLNKPLNETECWAAINLALAGGLPVGRTIMGRVVSSFNSSARIPLSAQQSAVANCMAKGIGNKQIAAELGLSLSGTKKSIHAIFGKLRASSRTDAVNRLHGRIG